MFLNYVVPNSIFIPILLGILAYTVADKGQKLLFYYLICSGLINFAAIVLIRYKMRNLPLLHLYTMMEATFLLGYFRTIFVSPRIKKILLLVIVVFPLLCIINFGFFQSIYSFNTYTRPLEAILITFFCLLYLYQSGFTENWLSKPINWFNMGMLIYFPVACIIFIVSNYMSFVIRNRPMNRSVWDLHGALVILMYLCWAYGFRLIKKNNG
jgi:hypothetical protein